MFVRPPGEGVTPYYDEILPKISKALGVAK